jgi:Fic family protein
MPLEDNNQQWIWQQADWPRARWDSDALAPYLREVTQLQGKLLGKVEAVAEENSVQSELDALLQNIVQSSAIEGENLNVESVRSSLAVRLGVKDAGLTAGTPQTEGFADLLLDATQNHQQVLTLERLFAWHRYLFPKSETHDFQLEAVRAGELRGEEKMQVASGPHNKRVIHFIAPPREGLENRLNNFLAWLETSQADASIDPILRAAQAHLWFVTLHPFDDGNGRLARAITDYALAQAEQQAIRFYAMAASIMEKRAEYYDILETTQKGDMDITPWLQWFVDTLKHALQAALERVDVVLQKARFWQIHGQDSLNSQQTKVLNRLLDIGSGSFEGGLSAAKYKSLARVSKATATRHLADLLEKNCIIRLEGGGRSTRYDINWPN